jgi:hypothetical protein
VYFRISEDEFRQFVSVCEQEGARSVSDLARSAVQRLITDGYHQRNGEELAEKMLRLERLIVSMTEQLRLLTGTRASDTDLTVNGNGTAAPLQSSEDRREQ